MLLMLKIKFVTGNYFIINCNKMKKYSNNMIDFQFLSVYIQLKVKKKKKKKKCLLLLIVSDWKVVLSQVLRLLSIFNYKISRV